VIWKFDRFILDPARRELRAAGVPVEVEPQVLDLLIHLVRHRDRMVSKDELFQAIWHGRTVSESALTTRINAARRAIGDDGRRQRLIHTLHGRGFRFVGKVEEREPPPRRSRALVDSVTLRVAPFTTHGGRDERGLAEEIAEHVVVALSRYTWLRVTAAAPTTASDARYCVTGSVHGRGDALRVSACLIDTGSAVTLWAERYEGAPSEGFAFHDRAAAGIAGSVPPFLQQEEGRRLGAAGPSTSSTASPFELYLRAQPVFPNSRAHIVRSLNLLERAIQLDPTYGAALADAGFCRQHLDINGWAGDRKANRRTAIDYARRALQHSTDPEAVATAAHVLAFFNADTQAALSLADQATRLNPNLARGWYAMGMVRLYAGQPEEASDCFEAGERLNPRDQLAVRCIAGVGLHRMFTGRLHEAIPRLQLATQRFPHWATPFCALIAAHARLGHARDAEALARRLRRTDATLAPTTVQFQDERHRSVLEPGLKVLQRLSDRRVGPRT
jgi:DNA-binding winged helix-turn-helix (wHTH) protein/tetratricopeptide (TPR) repeat protein